MWNAARCAIIHPQASKHDCLVNYTELSREKKHRILKRTPSGSFFSKGKLVAQVICVTAHTKSVRCHFLFESGSTIWGLSSFFSLAMFSTADGSCDSRSKVWFITEDVSIIILIKHEKGWALPYLALPGICCWTEYASFQGLESQAARVYNFTMLKASSTGCLWRMAILSSLNEWYNKIFSKTLVLVLKILNSVCETKWIRVMKLDLLL